MKKEGEKVEREEYYFFALLSRMKHIRRWGLMRNMTQENIQEHSLQVAMIAHGLAEIRNELFGGTTEPYYVAAVAMYHDVSEILTGDLPTPIKYYNGELSAAYKEIERQAEEQICKTLPERLRGRYEKVFSPDEETKQLVKAADKLSAYIKCVEEVQMGNAEFSKAKESTEKALREMNLPETEYFLKHFLKGFTLTLDELK